jgi:hypothetical protein
LASTQSLATTIRTSTPTTPTSATKLLLSSFLFSAFKTTVEVGDTLVCKRSIPNLGIIENSSHVITFIYSQYFDEKTQQIVKIQLRNLPLMVIIGYDNRRSTATVATGQ